MKTKRFSKVLALMVAAVMIFSALPLMAFAADEAATYTVSFGAPAIPMNVYTKLDLKTIAVEMVKGEAAVSGADITWAAADQEGLTFDATNKTVEVAAVGNYKLTATANGVTKNVWVVVKTEEQDKFYLVNIPVLNQESFVAEDWRLVGGKNDTELTAQDCVDLGNIAFTSTSMVIRKEIGSSKAGGALIYVNEIFKDFADYTVETYSASAANAAAQNLTNVGNGSIGRITLNDSETGWVTGVMSFVRNNEQIGISRTAVPKVDFGGFSPAAEFDGAWKIWNGSEGNHHTVKTVFDGSKVLFYLNETLLLDSTTEPKYEAQITTHHDGAGYPGMLAYGASGRFREFYVYLNSTEMPAAEKVTPPAPTPDPEPTPDPDPTPEVSYTVSFSAPAIPMNVYTKLDLRTVAIEMVKGEAAVAGSDITWAAAAQDGLTFDATNKTVEVAKVGNYKLTATANGITKNVWVVVKTEQQDKFYLVNMPKIDEETFVVNDWRLVSNYNDTDLTVQDVIDEGDIEFVDNGIKIYKNFTSHKVGGALIYANEIFKDFADYTVETYSKNETPPTLVDAGNGAVGRMTLNEKETGWVTGIMSYIRNNRQVSISRTNGVDDFGGFTDAGELGLWTEAHHNVKTVFDGSKVLFYLNDTLMLDSTTNATYEQRVVTHHDGAGYPGMLAYGANSVFDQFYVYLNSTEMPAAQKVTPPAPTPDQDPTPDPTPDQDPTPGTKPSKPNSPQTGDNTNLALWAALLFVSGLGIFAITLFGRNKREEN